LIPGGKERACIEHNVNSNYACTIIGFGKLVLLLSTDLAKYAEMARRSGGEVIDPAIRLAITLRVLSGASFHNSVLLFRVAKSTVFDIFYHTVVTITKRLRLPGIPFWNDEKLEVIAR
jgi:hypothetical protein